MKKILLFVLVVFFVSNLNAQFFVGANLNTATSYIPDVKYDKHFSVPYGANIGYSFKDKFMTQAVLLVDQYSTPTQDEIFYYQFPIVLAKRNTAGSERFYYDFGVEYSFSVIESINDLTNTQKTSMVSGPGFFLGLGVDFDRFQIQVGSMNCYEMFGDGNDRLQSTFFISNTIKIGH